MSKVRDFAEIISASDVATKTGTETLTNKTLTAPVADLLKLTPTTTANAPAGTKGAMYYDSDKDSLMQHDGTEWAAIYTPPPSGSGGTETAYTGYKVHTFRIAQTGSTFTVLNGPLTVDYLVIAGGGGGGAGHAGGGGAGGMRTATGFSVSSGEYTITVGAGGAGANSAGTTRAIEGGNSIFSSITATGGGGGGARSLDGGPGTGTVHAIGGDGGSGGGSGYGNEQGLNVGGDGINDGGTFGTLTYQGHNGGPHGNTVVGGSGGGGAGAIGSNGSGNNGGAGGAGTTNYYLTGSSGTTIGTHYFAGGGGGGPHTPGNGGSASYGGGAGMSGTGTPNAGVDDSGGGGGSGAYYSSVQGTGGAGGSGIVIIRYAV